MIDPDEDDEPCPLDDEQEQDAQANDVAYQNHIDRITDPHGND